MAARIVQRWRTPTNPISILKPEAPGNFEFLIAATYADKLPHRVASLLQKGKRFAFLVPTSLIPEVSRLPNGNPNTDVKRMMDSTTKIVMTAIGHTWVISHPAFKDKDNHQVLYTQEDEISAID